MILQKGSTSARLLPTSMSGSDTHLASNIIPFAFSDGSTGQIGSSSKRRKVLEAQHLDHAEDKISSLPDCVLRYILSFLPTREAVATCILSKRWKHLWVSVPNIDLDDSLLYSSQANYQYPFEVTCFMSFVERVLGLRDASAIKKFRLSCRVCFSASHVNAWVSTAIRHKVQELDLCLFVDEPFMLPECVFNSELLTSIKLEMNCILELPARISFQNLRTLHLCLITFPDDESTEKLFRSCPVLQELAILDCEWLNLTGVAISIPSLKYLMIDDLPCFGSNDDSHGCQIKIETENLVVLNYIGYLSNKIDLYNISASATASIYIPILSERRKDIACRVVKLFGGLSNVNSLRVSDGTIESLFLADNVMDHIPLFFNLKHLELSMILEDHTIGSLLELLQHFPKLECLCFCEGIDPQICLSEDYLKLQSVPHCILSSLKTLKLQYFHGSSTEMLLLTFFLRSTAVLEKLYVSCFSGDSGVLRNQKDFKNKIEKLQRKSKHCAVIFS